MAFMKKQVNAFLLLLILVSVLLIAAMSVFYQERLRTLSSDYLERSEELSACVSDLENTTSALESAQVRLSAFQGDVHQTVSLFEEKKEALESTEAELALAQERIAALESEVASEKAAREQAIRDKNAEIGDLRIEIAQLRSDLEACQEDLDVCQAS